MLKMARARLRALADTRGADGDWLAGRREMGMSRRFLAASALLILAASLAACGDMGRFQTAAAPSSPPIIKPNRTVATTPASEKEHGRILASYGGVYDDPKLES